MAMQQPKQKGFFAKYWGLLLGGVLLIGIVIIAAAVLVYLFVLRGNVKVTGLKLSGESIVYGKSIEASVTVENSGVLETKYQGALLVDGQAKALDEVSVPSKDPQTVKLELTGLEPGDHTVSIGEYKETFKVLTPAAFKVTGLAIDPAENILVGSTITMTATVSNTGETKGTYSPKVTLDGKAVDVASISIEPGKDKTLTLKIDVQDNGDHEIALDDQKLAFKALNPASIIATDMKLAKAYAKPNETVNITVTLKNSGDVAGTYSLEVFLNGSSAYKEDIPVDANSQKDVPLTVTEPKAGNYLLQVESMKLVLKVVSITRPASGTLLVKSANGGYCTLTINNGYTDRDAVIILSSTSNPKKPLLTIYIRKGEKTKKIKVKDGSYFIYYTTGTSFDSASKKFLTNPYYSRFDDTLVCTTHKTYYQTTWTDYTLTLSATNGNATETPVEAVDFPN